MLILQASVQMEAKLAQYRAKKEIQPISRFSTLNSWLFGNRNQDSNTETSTHVVNTSTVQSSTRRRRPDEVPQTTESSTCPAEPSTCPAEPSTCPQICDETSQKTWRDYIQLGLKIGLWLCLWKFCIEIGFGAVYFVVSCSYLMYRNTGTRPRERGRLSAYSVFNPNQERLDGTFTAEQFEKELRMGSGSVR